MLIKIKEAVGYVQKKSGEPCAIGIILGSGLGAFVDCLTAPLKIPYAEIPHFPTSSVAGHAGNLMVGTLHGHRVAVMQGRVHYYEGYSPDEVVFPVRVLAGAGVKTLIVTNAAGGVNRDFRPGDLMLISDHINLMGYNPLRGALAESFGPRFPDMSYAYNPALREVARQAARQLSQPLREGVYLGLSGPSYETPTEIRMLRLLGADAVGMSTVPETITAVQMGVKVLGISCITNMAAGILDQPLTHTEVMETTARIQREFAALLAEIVKSL